MIRPRHWLAPTLGIIVLGLTATAAEAARPGGGHSYSGGSSHSYSGGSRSYSSGSSYSGSSYRSSSGGSSGGGSSGSVAELVVLGVAALVIIPMKAVADMNSNGSSFDTSYAPPPMAPPPPRRLPARVYAALREHDPEFSAVLFEDFVYALYARVHAARQDPAAMAALAPYVSAGSREALLKREPSRTKIHGVVIGAMTVERVRIADSVRVEVEFESNYTAELPGGPQGYYVREAWVLERALDVHSRPPEAVQSFQCPACGAPYVRSDAGACGHCGREVEGGRFDWNVTFVRLLGSEGRPPALTGDVVEQGTGLPTVFDPTIRVEYAKFERDDPSATAAHVERRLHDIYAALNAAWTARDLRTIRPHVSDSLYNYLAYWIDAYRAQSLRNVLKDMEISRVQVVKLVRDKYFDAVTLRFWASGVDYTIGADGRLVSGNPKQKRVYSEYWTLIRGAKVRGAPRDVEKCPSCGAPLDRVSMAGNCEYCGAHLTLGEFDWVLSKIEQDESYTG